MSIDINKNYSEAVNKIRISQQSKLNKKAHNFLKPTLYACKATH